MSCNYRCASADGIRLGNGDKDMQYFPEDFWDSTDDEPA